MPSTLPKSRPFTLPEAYRDDFTHLKTLLSRHTRRAYFVGGCVRDFLLGIASCDFDIEVYDLDETAFAAVMDELGAVQAGKSFHVYKWKAFDLALPRAETKTGIGHTAFETRTIQDEQEASRRRDFTMNALMIHLFTGELLDHWDGFSDLQAGVLRHIDEHKFEEDSLRVLRAMQFAARFAFKIAPETIRVCRKIPLSDLSKERKFGEFEKLFRADYPHYGLYYGIRLDIFDKLFGLNIGFADFMAIVRELKKSASCPSEMQEYRFLYALYNRLHLKINPLLNALNAPTRYHRLLEKQKRRPVRVSDRFLKALSLHYPIRDWLGTDTLIARRAKDLGVYSDTFEHGIDIQDVIKAGFEKAAIRTEHKRRVCEELRKEPLG